MRRATGTVFPPSVPVLGEAVLPAMVCGACLLDGGLMAELFLARRATGVGVGVAKGMGCLVT